MNIPREDQASLWNLNSFLDDSPAHLDFQPGLELDFVPPANCYGDEAISYRSCRGRWLCECQVAGHGFHDPRFIRGNFILFHEDCFAVLFLDIQSISLYRRVSL